MEKRKKQTNFSKAAFTLSLVSALFLGGTAMAQVPTTIVGTEIVAKRCEIALGMNYSVKSIRLSGDGSFRTGERMIPQTGGSAYVDVVFDPKTPGAHYATLEADIIGGPYPTTTLCQIQANATPQVMVGFYPPQQRDFYVNENAGSFTFWVSRDNVNSSDMISINLQGFDGTATNGLDYMLNGSSLFSIPPGMSMVPITLNIIDDNIPEPEEVIDANITPEAAWINAIFYGPSAKVGNGHIRIHIVDNDGVGSNTQQQAPAPAPDPAVVDPGSGM